MSGVVVLNQPSVEIVNADGYSAVVKSNSSIPANASGVLVGGSDSGTIRLLRVAADGTLKIDPSGTTIQPISGTVAANIGATGGLALDITLTAGSQKTQVVSGSNILDIDSSGRAAIQNPSNLDVTMSTRASEATLSTLLTEAEFEARMGEVQVTPAAYTVLGRLKDIRSELETRLPASLVGGRLDSNVGAWLGSTAPTVGQKSAALSIPVTMASDQPPLQVNVTSSTKPHYYILFDRIVPAANKYMGTLFNPLGSGKLLEVENVYVLNWQNAGNQSATLDEYIAFITNRSGGTSVPIRKFDTSSAGSVMQSFTNDTTVTESYIIRRFFASINQVNLANANWFNALAFAVNGEIFSVKNDVAPLTFRAGEGMALRNVTNNTSGSVSYIIEFAESSL
jgi:hypothetical protein